MNDIILSSLLNLFALFGTQNKADRAKSDELLTSYLIHHFGIRDLSSYLSLYHDLRDFYDDSDGLDIELIIQGVCSKLQGNITEEEQRLMLLRLMEFCSKNQENGDSIIFEIVAKAFRISEETLKEYHTFINGKEESETVRAIEHPEFSGYIKTMYLKEFDLLLFSCHSEETFKMNDIPVLPQAFQIWHRSGTLKNKHGYPLYYYQIMGRYRNKGNGNESQDIVMKGKDINFIYKNSGGNGIHNLSFGLYSGELVAVMGGSGTGKSTLLSILNGSLRPQNGTLTVNGHDISEPQVKDLIGFVPQDDLLIEELTVYENLWFTGKLCFEGLPDQKLDEKVKAILKDLGLTAASNLKVGSPINKYISGGQRKRLNIALELIREPAILFLDEPTSGLPSADAETLVSLLKEQAFKGKIVVSIIHQPSSDVYQYFDRLWLLDRGGYPIYDGNPIEAITYFKRAANFTDSDMSTCPTCGTVNPEIMLDIIEDKALTELGKPTDTRKISPKEWHEKYLQEKAERKKAKGGKDSEKRKNNNQLPPTDQKRPNPLKQTGIFLWRNIKMKLTNLQYILITLLEAPVLALICALLTRYAPIEGYSIMNNSNLVSYYFMAIIVAIFLGMSGSAEEIIKDRAVLKREKFLHLSYSSYIWSKILFMAGVTLIQTLLFILVGNSIMGINGMISTWWCILFISAFLASLTGLLLSQSMNSIVAIYITIPILLIPQILLCGLVVKFSDLTPRSTTGNVPVLGDVIPSRWAFEALTTASFSDNSYEKPFFEEDKEKYSTQFFQHSYLYEMKSQLETLRSKQKKGEETKIDHMEVIKNSLPTLAYFCKMEEYQGDYSYNSLKQYFEKASDILQKRSNTTTLALDRKMTEMIRKTSKENMVELKRNNFNLQLETLVTNSTTKKLCNVVDGHIVPNAGFIYLEPFSHNGRAPFYSSTKILGETRIKTLHYNMAILLMMCLVVAICLFNDFPGRFIRQKRDA